MVTFGLDISHHQAASLDLAQCRREGIEFIFLKSSEGADFVDSAFAANLAEARRAGMVVAAYHYVRSNATAAAQVANVARVVPRDVPVIPDVEANSGGVALVRDFVARLQAAGYRVPVTYLPRWYWQQIGSPSLAGLPSLWSSRYPDNVVGSLTDEYNRAPASYWAGYGGLGVTVLQFTSSARVAGHAPLDANAYLGTREQMAALLGGEEDDMPTVKEIVDGVWSMPGAHPDNPAGIKMGDQLAWTNHFANQIPALAAAVTAIATDQDITPEQLAAVVDKAVKEHTPTAEQTAAALLPLVEDITERVLGADNKALAEEFLRQLREALPSTPEGTSK